MWQRRSSKRRRRRDGPLAYCVVEPGTSTLRLLIVEASAGAPEAMATVWGWAERPGCRDTEQTWLADDCAAALREAEEMAQDLADRWLLPDGILVGLPPSQIRGWAWPVSQRRSRPERPVEERELEALLERGLRLAVNRLRDTAPGQDNWLLLDSAVVALTVDGRGVTDPVGFRGREIGATVFAALAPAEIVLIWRAVARELEFSDLVLSAAPLAMAAGMSEAQGLVLDVGAATTDLVWYRGGQPIALDSVALGGELLSEALVRKWHVASNGAAKIKRAYTSGRLNGGARAEVQEVLLPAVQTWLAGTEAVLEHMNQDELLPEQLHLAGGGSVLPEIAESVRALAWSKRLRFARYPQVHSLRPTDVPGVVNRTELGRQPGDVAALALAAWLGRQQKPADRPARILAELCHG